MTVFLLNDLRFDRVSLGVKINETCTSNRFVNVISNKDIVISQITCHI